MKLVTSFNMETKLYNKWKEMNASRGVSKSELMNIALKEFFAKYNKRQILGMVKSVKKEQRIKHLKARLKAMQ